MPEEALAQTEPEVEVENDLSEQLDAVSEQVFPKEVEDAEEIEVEEVEEVEDEPEIEEESETEQTEEKEEEIEVPNSWKKEMVDNFKKLDESTRQYILQREAQMREGLDKDRTDANLGRTMRDIMKPHQTLFQQEGIEGPQAVQYLLNAHYKLSTGTPEQKKQYLNHLAQSYGVNSSGETNVDPQVQSLQQRLQQIEKNLTASQQRTIQAEQARIEAEVDTFAKTHPLLEELSDEIAVIITASKEYGNEISLEDAYDKALWANPVTRQKEIERIEAERNKEAEKQAKKEAEEAKKAKSVNVASRNTRRSSTKPLGTMEDTMNELLREIESRN